METIVPAAEDVVWGPVAGSVPVVRISMTRKRRIEVSPILKLFIAHFFIKWPEHLYILHLSINLFFN